MASLARFAGLALGGVAGILAAEYGLARAAPRLDGFTPEELSGVLGEGEGLRVAWIGDSMSAGVGVGRIDETYPHQVVRRLGRRVELHVLAVSGARAGDALRDQAPALDAIRPDLVVLQIGGNDTIKLTSRPRLRRDLDALHRAARASGASHVLAMAFGGFADTILLKQPLRALADARGRQILAEVRAAAERHGATFVDLYARCHVRFHEDPARFHAIDGFHLSADGLGLWADATLDAIDEAGWFGRLPDAPRARA